METLRKDVQFGLRLLSRNPAFTLVAVLSLGLGIGVNTAIFSVVNAVLLAPVPVRDPDRLVEIYMSQASEMPYLTTSYPDFLDLRASVDALSGLGGHGLVRGLYRRGQDRAELVSGEVVTENYFDMLGVRLALGRASAPEENRTELTHPVLIVSEGFWKRRLGGTPDVLGRRVELSGVEYTVIGVAPPEFTGTVPGLLPEFWAPVMMVEKLNFSGLQAQSPSPGRTRLEQRGMRWLFVTGRLAPGRTVAEARAQVETTVARLVRDYPAIERNLKAVVLRARDVRLHPMVDGELVPAAALLMGAVGLVLLIACVNVANMLLARASARRREIAVRLAIGATRWRVVRQLLTESLALALLGGAFGLVIAFWTTRLLAALHPTLPVPLLFHFNLDARVLLFAALASISTTVTFGLVPALQASRPELVPALRGEAGAAVPTGRRIPPRDVLVALQLALSLVLLVAGALLLRGLGRANQIHPGFDPDRLAELSFNLKMNGYTVPEATAFQRRMTERLKGLPGVAYVSLVSRPPLGSDISTEGVRVPGRHGPEDEATSIDATWVEPDYFPVLGIPILEGRGFTDADDERSPRVVIVNEAMARRYWAGRSPIGDHIYTEGFDGPATEIVGVVPDYKVRDLGEEPRPYLHFAWRQQEDRATTIVARTTGAAALALAGLRNAILELEPGVVFSDEGTGSDLLRLTLAPTRAGAALLSAFGVLALVLAAGGLYGVVSYSVAQRTREVGIRMALGAGVGDVLGLVLGKGMRLAALGVGIGALASVALTRALRSLLYGVSTIDPVAFAGAAVLLLAVAFAANLVPARRAARVNPTVALRYE